MNVGELFVNGIMNISGTLVIESFSIFEGSLLSCNGSVIVFSKLISIKSNLIIV